MNRRRFAPVMAGMLLAMVGGLTCTELSGPRAELTRVGMAPRFTRAAEGALKNLANFHLDLNNIRVRLDRGDGSTAVDTVVSVNPGDESVSVELTVRVNGTEEQFNAVIELRAGDLVLFSGTQLVVAKTTGSSSSGPPIDVEYVGPGAGAVDVNVLPGEIAILSNQTAAFTAVAFDASEQELPDLLVDWSVRDAALGSVSDAGVFTPVAGVRGSTWVIATLPTNVTDSARVTVSPLPTQAVLVEGGDQNGTLGQTLSPFVFEVRAADGLPVAGVDVTFDLSGDIGQLSTTTGTTDAQGRVSVTLTLGDQPVRHFVHLLIGDVSYASATAMAGVGQPIALHVEGIEGTLHITHQAGQPLPAQYAVRVADALQNGIPNVQLRLTWSPQASSEVLLQTTATSDQNGRVLLSALGSLNQAGSFDLRVALVEPSSVSPLSISVDVVAAPAASLGFSTQPPTAQAGAPFTVAVAIRDAQGNVATSFSGAVTVALGSNPAQASLSGTLTRNAVAGVATFDDLVMTRAAAGYTLSASAADLEPAASVAFNVDAGVAASLVFTTVPTTVEIGATFLAIVSAMDAFGNLSTSFAGSVSVNLGNNPGDALLSGTLTVAAANGLATFGDLSLNAPGTGYTLSAAGGSLTGQSSQFDVAAPAALEIFPVNDIAHHLINAAGSQTLTVQVTDEGRQNNMPGVPVAFSLERGSCALNSPTAVTTDASGLASIDVAITGTASSCSIRAAIANQGTEPPQAFQHLYVAPTGFAVWTGATSQDWSPSQNWIGTLPSPSTPVFVPGSGAFTHWPNIAGTTPMFALIVEAGALLNVTGDTIVIADSLIADGIVNGTNATVILNGSSGQSVRGFVQAKLMVGNAITGRCDNLASYRVTDQLFADSIQVDCTLTLDAGAAVSTAGSFRVSGMGTLAQNDGGVSAGGAAFIDGQMSLRAGSFGTGGNFTLNQGGVLTQTDGVIVVSADASFAGLATLTGGVLSVSRNFTHVGNGDNFRFDAQFPHVTSFVGDATDTLRIVWEAPPGGLPSRFGQLDFFTSGEAGMTFVNGQLAANISAAHVTIGPQARLFIPPGRYQLTMGGVRGQGLFIAEGGRVTVDPLAMVGALTVSGATCVLVGTVTASCLTP